MLPSGRLMHAVVLEQRGQHLYELAAGQLRLMAQSQAPLRRGESLQLQLIGWDSQQRPRLRIHPPSQLDTAPLLRERLPQQRSLNQLMSHLSASQTEAAGARAHVLAPLLACIPRHRELNSPRALKQALANSGQFFEARLLKGQYDPGDLKAQLLVVAERLATQTAPPPRSPLSTHYPPIAGSSASQAPYAPGATPAPATPYSGGAEPSAAQGLPGQLSPQARLNTAPGALQATQEQSALLSEVRGALARLDVLQLLQRRGQKEGRCLIELPVMDSDGIDIWQLLFLHTPPHYADTPPKNGSAARQHGPPPPRSWRVELCVDLPGLGPIKASLSDCDERLDIAFTVTKPDTLSRLERRCNDLRARLERRQVAVAKIHCEAGEATEQRPQQPLAALLQERA